MSNKDTKVRAREGLCLLVLCYYYRRVSAGRMTAVGCDDRDTRGICSRWHPARWRMEVA